MPTFEKGFPSPGGLMLVPLRPPGAWCCGSFGVGSEWKGMFCFWTGSYLGFSGLRKAHPSASSHPQEKREQRNPFVLAAFRFCLHFAEKQPPTRSKLFRGSPCTPVLLKDGPVCQPHELTYFDCNFSHSSTFYHTSSGLQFMTEAILTYSPETLFGYDI